MKVSSQDNAVKKYRRNAVSAMLAIALLAAFGVTSAVTAQEKPVKIGKEAFIIDASRTSGITTADLTVYEWKGEKWYAAYGSDNKPTLARYTESTVREDGTVIPRKKNSYLGSDQNKNNIYQRKVGEEVQKKVSGAADKGKQQAQE